MGRETDDGLEKFLQEGSGGFDPWERGPPGPPTFRCEQRSRFFLEGSASLRLV